MAPARADEPSPGEAKAYELYRAAGEDWGERDFEAAVEKLKAAYELFPKAIILIKLAEGYEHLGRVEEAYAAFAEVEPEEEPGDPEPWSPV